MRTITLVPVVLMAAAVVGCAEPKSPVAPNPQLVSVAIGEAPLTIARNQAVNVRAMATYTDGLAVDVTATAIWSSSDAAVLRVDGGRLTAIGIGQAVVRVDFEGRVANAAITARRNTKIGGSITVSSSPGSKLVSGLKAFIDGQLVGRIGYNSDFGGDQLETVILANVLVVPGARALDVDIARPGLVEAPPTAPATPHTFFASPAPVLRVTDADTGQELGSITLPTQQIVMRARGMISWTVDVPLYDR